MKEFAFRARMRYHVAVRKLRTLLQGPPEHPDFIRAAHYFSDGWALNMWQVLDPASILPELRTIQADGFNTIILVFPWRGFQTDQLCPDYDRFYERQLRRVLGAADRLGLSVIVRVAYTYQVTTANHLSGITQAQRLLTDDATREAWLDYLARLYSICHSHRSFRQGFISWEEFWHAFGSWQLREPRPRKEQAIATGYREFLAVQGYEDVLEIPRPGDPAQASFHAFTNLRIRQFYDMAQSVFPGLSMEFRVDKERLEKEGEIQWLKNDDYSDSAELRFSYWAPFMGAQNNGEKLNADQAAHLLEHMLDEVSYQGSRPGHVVDQFNFIDETPKYKGVHAEIQEEQMVEFLKLAVPLMREKSRGYGIWAYRDYRQNILFNARFMMGMRGWKVLRGRARVSNRGGIRLESGAILRQFLPPTVSGLQRGVGFEALTLILTIRWPVLDPAVRVRINAGSWGILDVAESDAVLRLAIPVDFGAIMADGLLLEICNDGPRLDIGLVSLYHWVFRGGIRQENGDASRHHAEIVEFNRNLQDCESGPSPGRTD